MIHCVFNGLKADHGILTIFPPSSRNFLNIRPDLEHRHYRFWYTHWPGSYRCTSSGIHNPDSSKSRGILYRSRSRLNSGWFLQTSRSGTSLIRPSSIWASIPQGTIMPSGRTAILLHIHPQPVRYPRPGIVLPSSRAFSISWNPLPWDRGPAAADIRFLYLSARTSLRSLAMHCSSGVRPISSSFVQARPKWQTLFVEIAFIPISSRRNQGVFSALLHHLMYPVCCTVHYS